MLEFVSIKTGNKFTFDNWDFVIKNGGLKKIIPNDEYEFTYEKKAVKETIGAYTNNLIVNRLCNLPLPVNEQFIEPFIKANNFFNNL